MAKAKELREQGVAELKALYGDLSKQIFQLNNERKMKPKEGKPHLARACRKDRARVLTVLRQKTQ